MPSDGKTVVIYEAVNKTLREIFVGAAEGAAVPEDLARLHEQSLPKAIGHWRPGQNIVYRIVEIGLPRHDSGAFLHAYALEVASVGWRVIAD